MDFEQYKSTVGLIIKKKRESMNITQEELSARIDLSQGNLSNIENGKNFPSMDTFFALVEILNIEPNQFLSFLKFQPEPKSILDIELQEYIKPLSSDLKYCLSKIIKKIKD